MDQFAQRAEIRVLHGIIGELFQGRTAGKRREILDGHAVQIEFCHFGQLRQRRQIGDGASGEVHRLQAGHDQQRRQIRGRGTAKPDAGKRGKRGKAFKRRQIAVAIYPEGLQIREPAHPLEVRPHGFRAYIYAFQVRQPGQRGKVLNLLSRYFQPFQMGKSGYGRYAP